MTSLPLTRRVIPCIVLAFQIACGADAQSGDDFRVQLEAAFEQGGLNTLIEQNRLSVKPVVHTLITESLEAELAGEHSTAAAKLQLARASAAAFEQQFDETSLSEAVSYLDEWSLEEKRAKLRADSLRAHGRELRSGEEAHRAYLDALAIYEEIGDRVGVAETLGGVGVVHWFGGNADSTLSYFKRGLEARREVDDRQLVGNSLNDIGSALLYFHQDYGEALPSYLKAAGVREEIGDKVPLARTYNLIATSHLELGSPDSALTYYRRAIALNRENDEQTWLAANLMNAASTLVEMGRPSEALSLLDESERIAKEIGDTTRVAEALNWKGGAYRRVGDHEAAIEAYQKVVDISKQTGNETELAWAHQNIGVLLDHAERPDRAVSQYQTALTIFEKLEDPNGRLLAALGLSNAHNYLEEFEDAERYARLAIEISRQLDNPANVVRSLITLGNVQVVAGEEEAALENFSKALEQARTLESPDLIWTSLLGHGDYYERRSDYRRAVEYYEKGLEMAESVRGNLYSDEEKAGFLAQKRFAYEHIIHMLGKLHKQEPDSGHDLKAFEVAEQAKARAFLDMLAESISAIETGVDPQLKKRRSDLIAEIGDATQEVQAAAQAADEEAQTLARERLATLEDEYRSLQREIRMTNPAYGALQFPEPVSLKKVQSDLLDDDTVLLQYALGDSSSAMWAVSAEGRSFHALPDRGAIREQVELIRFALEKPDESQASIFAAAAHELYRLLLEPAESILKEGRHLVVVPDDILHYVPFEALLTTSISDASIRELPYLIRQYSISYGQSASVLLQLQRQQEDSPDHERDLLAFGDPVFEAEEGPSTASSEMLTRSGLERLPHSGTEVRSIAELFQPDRTSTYLRDAAVEERLKASDALNEYKYIHFATHGLINERRPDFSSIVLTLDQNQSEDGFLQAAEIFNLSMNPDLVVLSACETGLGKMIQGEGIVGLTRAFMYAGAPSIVVSLWRVADESTAELMHSFYARLASSNQSKSASLRTAKLEMLDTARFAHPFYWAPFVMVGGWN